MLSADALPLTGMHAAVVPADAAFTHAAGLLRALGAVVTDVPSAAASVLLAPQAEVFSAAEDWARCGAMALTGRSDGPALAAPGAPASAVRGALMVLQALVLSGGGGLVEALPGVELLGERAALAGLARRGPQSAGGHYRPLRCADGWWGLSLARPDDLDLLPALVEGDVGQDPWGAVQSWSASRTAASASARAQLLGIPACRIDLNDGYVDEQAQARHPDGLRPWLLAVGPDRVRRGPLLVVDLTSLWAGPLCSHLLGLAGARVIKVESTRRPDGARRGSPAFFDLLHEGHESVALDLTSQAGQRALGQLVARADVVLEASRPRALEQLGLHAEEVVAAGTTWTSITAYGRTGPWSNRVGFGDDVAAAAGLVAWEGSTPMPCGDALADPLAGVHAAVATTAALLSGRAHLIDVSMRDVSATALRLPTTQDAKVVARAPRARAARGRGPHVGEHTDSVLAELA